MTTPEYLQPVLAAADLLELRVYAGNVEQLTAVLDTLARGYPMDVLTPLEALRILAAGPVGTVEELEILKRLWPDWNGSVRYRLTASTLTWQWSSKHSGVYSTITVPFPTILPMTIEVERWCDMDLGNNHSDECPVYHSEDEDNASDDCNCEGWVEQTVSATVIEWTDAVEASLVAWLSAAVIEHVEPLTLPVPVAAPTARRRRPIASTRRTRKTRKTR